MVDLSKEKTSRERFLFSSMIDDTVAHDMLVLPELSFLDVCITCIANNKKNLPPWIFN